MNPSIQQSASSMVKTGIWDQDEFVESHSIEDTFLLLFLLTCPDRHLSGIIKLNFRLVTARTKWEKNQVQIVLNRLQDLGDVVLDWPFVWVKGYFDHNQAPAHSHLKQIRDRLSEVSDFLREAWILDARERGFADELFQFLDTPPIPPLQPPNTQSGNNNSNDNVNLSCNRNNNDNEVVGRGDLKFSKLIDEKLRPELEALLCGREDAQEILDELAAGIDQSRVVLPVPWVKGVIKKGLSRSLGGLSKTEQRLKAHLPTHLSTN